jgi:hypothetical protein
MNLLKKKNKNKFFIKFKKYIFLSIYNPKTIILVLKLWKNYIIEIFNF